MTCVPTAFAMVVDNNMLVSAGIKPEPGEVGDRVMLRCFNVTLSRRVIDSNSTVTETSIFVA